LGISIGYVFGGKILAPTLMHGKTSMIKPMVRILQIYPLLKPPVIILAIDLSMCRDLELQLKQ